MSSIGSVTGVSTAAVVLQGAGLEHLKKANPKVSEIFKQNPGVLKLLEKLSQAGAIYQPKAGDVATKFSWPVWTHSPLSSPGSITKANEKDVIIVWQEVPGSSASVQLGGQRYPGQVIALHQIDQRGGSSPAR